MPDEVPQRRETSSVGWGFAVLAAVIVIIMIGWGVGGNGGGWGRSEMAHMTPPAGNSDDGPATRSWIPKGH